MRRFFTTLWGCIYISLLFGSIASASPVDWRDAAYDFSKVRYIVIKDAQFSYSEITRDNRDKFELYPLSNEKIGDMVKVRLGDTFMYRWMTMADLVNKIKEDYPGFEQPIDSLEFAALVKQEMPRYADLILQLEIRDYGWMHEYRPPYDEYRTDMKKVRYSGKNPDGKEYSGWMEVPETVVVHHEAGFNIFDSAKITIELVDAKSTKTVWKFNDARTRSSVSWMKEYDPTGPESMMKRILDEAFKRIPVPRKAGKS